MAYEEQAIPTVTTAAPAAAPLRRAKWWSGVLKFIRKKPLGAIGFAIVGLLVFATLGTPQAEFRRALAAGPAARFRAWSPLAPAL